MDSLVGCVVIPTYGGFLETLVKRNEQFTTLIWPGRTTGANRMVSPHDWFDEGPRKPDQERQPPQRAVPFLYRSIGEVQPPYAVTHVGLAIYMVHDVVYSNTPAIREALSALRVECFSDSDGWGDEGVRTWYVVTGAFQLHGPIQYNQLWLITQDRPLESNFTRGYGLVWLPEDLRGWYSDCLAKHAGLLETESSERWRHLRQAGSS